MNARLEKLKSNRFAKNFLKLFSATLLAQVITLSLSPVLTRLYSPEDFGYYSIYMAIVSLVIVYATGRYEFAISVAKTEEESATLFKVVILFSTISSIILLATVLLFEGSLISLLGSKKQPQILYYIPLTIFALGIMQGLNYYLNRQKNFTDISRAKILQSGVNGTSSIVFAYTSYQTLGMIWANILAMIISNIYNFRKLKIWYFLNFKKYKLKDIKKSAIKFKSYPLWNSTSAFLDVLSVQAPVLILNRYFSEAIIGFYSLTIRVVAFPITIISSAIGQVYLSELVEKENNGQPIYEIVKKAAKVLAILGLVPLIALLFLGPSLFSFVFGEKWRYAGELARILSFDYYMKFVVSPLSVVFFVRNRIKQLSILQFFRAITTVAVLVISCILVENLNNIVTIYVVYEVFYYCLYYYFILKVSK